MAHSALKANKEWPDHDESTIEGERKEGRDYGVGHGLPVDWVRII
jgi:hypothetical protein